MWWEEQWWTVALVFIRVHYWHEFVGFNCMLWHAYSIRTIGTDAHIVLLAWGLLLYIYIYSGRLGYQNTVIRSVFWELWDMPCVNTVSSLIGLALNSKSAHSPYCGVKLAGCWCAVQLSALCELFLRTTEVPLMPLSCFFLVLPASLICLTQCSRNIKQLCLVTSRSPHFRLLPHWWC